jgi:hypothetical protein
MSPAVVAAAFLEGVWQFRSVARSGETAKIEKDWQCVPPKRL